VDRWFHPIKNALRLGLALVANTVKPEKIGVAMACVSIQLNLGLTLGPLLGGIVYDKIGWYGTFASGFGILGIDILLRLVMIEKHVADRYRPQENNEIQVEKTEHVESIQSKSRKCQIPEVIRLLKFPRLLAAMWLTFTQATMVSAFDAVLPLHLNQLFGWTSFQAGVHSSYFS
jgi:MFS family permease